jgi:hypothetical protein
MSTPSELPIETLRRFVYNVEQLQARRLIEEQDLTGSMNLSAAKGGPLKIRYHEPDEEDFRSYLLDFRKFMAAREPIFLNRVLEVARRHVTSDEIVAGLASARSAWKDALRKGTVRYMHNDEHFSPETILDLWINGWYFHDDTDKRRRLEAFAKGPMSRWLFLNSIVGATEVILYSGHVLKIALREGLVSDTPVR